MAKTVRTVSSEGFTASTEIRDFDLDLDATGDEAPDTLEALLATYGACYVPALRVGGQQNGVEDLGHVEIDITGELNDDDKLASVHFDVRLEEDVDDSTIQDIVDRADALCKVRDALKSDLHASVEVEAGV